MDISEFYEGLKGIKDERGWASISYVGFFSEDGSVIEQVGAPFGRDIRLGECVPQLLKSYKELMELEKIHRKISSMKISYQNESWLIFPEGEHLVMAEKWNDPAYGPGFSDEEVRKLKELAHRYSGERALAVQRSTKK